jgi:DNA polymerase-3 subunit delta'
MKALDHADAPPPEGTEARAALAGRAGGSVRSAIILTQYGGLEIAEALHELLAAPHPDVAAAHRLADVVAARDQALRFDIFNRHALDLLSDAASAAARANDIARANRLSEAWQEAVASINEGETYNLDKKQHALNLVMRLNAAMRM